MKEQGRRGNPPTHLVRPSFPDAALGGAMLNSKCAPRLVLSSAQGAGRRGSDTTAASTRPSRRPRSCFACSGVIFSQLRTSTHGLSAGSLVGAGGGFPGGMGGFPGGMGGMGGMQSVRQEVLIPAPSYARSLNEQQVDGARILQVYTRPDGSRVVRTIRFRFDHLPGVLLTSHPRRQRPSISRCAGRRRGPTGVP